MNTYTRSLIKSLKALPVSERLDSIETKRLKMRMNKGLFSADDYQEVMSELDKLIDATEIEIKSSAEKAKNAQRIAEIRGRADFIRRKELIKKNS